jgi:DnaJ-class molecular chaperone
MTHLNESVIDVCDCCGGDGEFDEPAAWVPTTIKCRHCKGEGFVLVEAEPADEFWMEEA